MNNVSSFERKIALKIKKKLKCTEVSRSAAVSLMCEVAKRCVPVLSLREGDGGRGGGGGGGGGGDDGGAADDCERPPTSLRVYPPRPAAASAAVPDSALTDKQMLDKFLVVKPVSAAA